MACISPYYQKSGGEIYPVPCGRCPECKLRRVQQWAFRLVQEDKVSSSGHFITLTYDTDHVPISPNGYMTLLKTDFQKFIKRLRKKKTQTNKLKYYAAGEYGTKNDRPHYHAIIFNVEQSIPLGENLKGNMEFTNKDIAASWTKGKIDIQDASGASAAYCAKYIDKDKTIPRHANDDRQKEFSLMSKGLGKSYITTDAQRYHQDDLTRTYLTDISGIKIPMPEYYKKILYTEEQREHIRNNALHTLDEAQIKERLEHYKTYVEEKYPHFMLKYDKIAPTLSKFNKLAKLKRS